MSEQATPTEEPKDDGFFSLGEPVEVVDTLPTPEQETVPVAVEATQGEVPTPGNEAATPEATPETPAAPSWWDEMPPEDRRALAESELSKLSPEDRANLLPVKELVTSARQSESARTRTQIEDGNAETQRQNATLYAAQTLAQRINAGTVDDTNGELNSYAGVVMRLHEERLGDRLSDSLVNAMAAVGIDSDAIPRSVIDEAVAAKARGGVVAAYQVYNAFAIQEAERIGATRGQTEATGLSKAKDAADVARIRAEYKTELIANGNYIDNVPPLVSGSHPAGTSSGEVTEEEWEEVKRDPDAYSRLMADPQKAAFIRSLMVSV